MEGGAGEDFKAARRVLALLPQGKRRSRLETWLEVELQARFSGRILSIEVAVADRRGLLTAVAKIERKPLSAIDGLRRRRSITT